MPRTVIYPSIWLVKLLNITAKLTRGGMLGGGHKPGEGGHFKNGEEL